MCYSASIYWAHTVRTTGYRCMGVVNTVWPLDFPRWDCRPMPSEALFPHGTRGFATEEALSLKSQGRTWLRASAPSCQIPHPTLPPCAGNAKANTSWNQFCQKKCGTGARWHWTWEHLRPSLCCCWGHTVSLMLGAKPLTAPSGQYMLSPWTCSLKIPSQLLAVWPFI